MSDSNLILEVKGLNKWFGATYANKNIDFQLRPGEVRGLAGENGSGKSAQRLRRNVSKRNAL